MSLIDRCSFSLENLRFLALDTSTDAMSVALTDGATVWQHSGTGAVQASTALLPVIFDLLDQAHLKLTELDAIVFGRGPGAFTGLRTACSVAQGLALGAKVAVLPVDTLMALAEEARWQQHQAAIHANFYVTTLLDARMGEIYVQSYAFVAGVWHATTHCELRQPAQISISLEERPSQCVLAGNVFEVYKEQLPSCIESYVQLNAVPTAMAMLRLAPVLLQQGFAVTAEHALPVYVRNKVASTTQERAQEKMLATVPSNHASSVMQSGKKLAP